MRPLHLLVVEDKLKLLNSLCRGLEEEGFAVLSANTAEAAERAIAQDEFDAIVLDLRLPGKDGIEFLRELRAAGGTTPVLILTARGSIEERVAGLETGADDYLTKPFAFAELVARIRALVRRAVTSRTILRVSDLEFDTVKRRARRAGRELYLSPKETLLLELLLRNSGEIVTRAMITEVVWGSGYNDFSNLIQVFVNRLREKIDKVGPPLIATVRGAGYSIRVHE